jgi:hypothetical protein
MSGGDVVLSFSRQAVRAVRSAALLLFASMIVQASAVTVAPTVTAVGGMYQYAYSISYTGTDDAFLVDIPVASDPGAVMNLTTPSGFTSQFDYVSGLVSFLENGSFFQATPTSGFSFDSYLAPESVLFNASVVGSSGIYNVAGSTVAPTPEPAYFYLLALMAPALLFFKRRNSNSLTNGQATCLKS